MDDPKLKNKRRPNNRGHSQKWHEGKAHDIYCLRNNICVLNHCPCGGRPQAVSPRLEARLAAFDPGNQSAGLLHHRPGSQNRKK